MASKEELLIRATLAEKAERYEDMYRFMLDAIKHPDPLTENDRNLLSIACKNRVGGLRTACRFLGAGEEKYQKDPLRLECARELRQSAINDITPICQTIVDTIHSHVLNRDLTPNDKVFYVKMRGDYYRYLAEVLTEDARDKAADEALSAYTEAQTLAADTLEPSNTVRLGLALNCSVFYYEIRNDVETARKITKEALKKALESSSSEDPETLKDRGLIIQLLRDNLTLWDTEVPSSSADEEYPPP